MAICQIGLGANLGDRTANIEAAIASLTLLSTSSVVRQSKHYPYAAAVGGPSQNEFLNAAVTLQTSLSPAQLLSALQGIEKQLGRKRGDRWAARDIDLDLLLYDDLIVSDAQLALPHPRLAFRRFVLEPLVEIASDFIHPTTGFTFSKLLTQLDKLPRRIAITGPIGEKNNQLACKVAAKCGASLIGDPINGGLSDRFTTLLASPLGRTAIELANRQRAHQRSARLNATNSVEIAGSWIGECHALAKLLLPSSELARFERELKFTKDVGERDHPTLLAVLLEPVRDQQTQSLQAEIRRLATVPRQSPWLLLDAMDTDWALRELVAAVEAMQ